MWRYNDVIKPLHVAVANSTMTERSFCWCLSSTFAMLVKDKVFSFDTQGGGVNLKISNFLKLELWTTNVLNTRHCITKTQVMAPFQPHLLALMNDHFVLLSGPATCGNMAPWMLNSEAELAGFLRHTAYLHWKMWKWAGSQTWCHLGCTRNGFWQKLGQATTGKVWKFWWRSSHPFCQAILNS